MTSGFGTKQISFRPFNKKRNSILKKFDSEELLVEDFDDEVSLKNKFFHEIILS